MKRAAKDVSGFTLMELLAAVTLMVILGTMLFSVFKSSSAVVRDATGRQLVYQQAKLFIDHMEQELSGVHWLRDANTTNLRLRPFQIAGNGQAISMTTSCKVRDTRGDSATYGNEANMGRIGYFLGDGSITLADGTVTDKHTLYRYEYYTLYGSGDDPADVQKYATPFISNVVVFSVEHINNGVFSAVGGWDSNIAVANNPLTPLPKAVRITLSLTDDRHLKEYDDMTNDKNGDGVVDKNEADDDIGQTFEYVGYLGSRVW